MVIIFASVHIFYKEDKLQSHATVRTLTMCQSDIPIIRRFGNVEHGTGNVTATAQKLCLNIVITDISNYLKRKIQI